MSNDFSAAAPHEDIVTIARMTQEEAELWAQDQGFIGNCAISCTETLAALGLINPTRDGPRTDDPVERRVLENAINRMGWDEIRAFQNELRKGQDIYEDAGGFFMRAIKALFGIKSKDPVINYQDAARAMVTAALAPAAKPEA